jgi:hypothetical protein
LKTYYIRIFIMFKYNKMTDTDTNIDTDINMSDYIFNEKGTELLNNIIAARKISPIATNDALIALNNYISEKLSEFSVLPKE